MPLKALGLACAVVVLSSPLASAQVNFDELFNTIAFNDEAPPPVPEAAEDEPPSRRIPTLNTVPSQLSPASGDESAGALDAEEQSLLVPSVPEEPTDSGQPPEPIRPSEPTPPEAVSIPADGSRTDHPGLTDPPAIAPNGHRIDFDALLSDCEPAPTRLHVPTATNVGPAPHEPHPAAGHLASPPPNRIACAAECGGRPSESCKTCVTHLRPTPCLERPNLPPPTSLEAAYRTPACYRDLWGGYQQQRQRECQCHHKHLHGHCKCLNPPPSSGAHAAGRPR